MHECLLSCANMHIDLDAFHILLVRFLIVKLQVSRLGTNSGSLKKVWVFTYGFATGIARA